MLRRTNPELILTHIDEQRLSLLVEPLALTRPSEVSRQLETLGGPEVLFSDPAQVAIASWVKAHQALPILREMAQAVSSLLKAYQKGDMANSQAVLRALPVLYMCAFVSGGEGLRQDLADILGCSSPHVPGLIRSYKIAAILADHSRVGEVDRRIRCDSMWSSWVQLFLQEGNAIIRLSRPVTHWEFRSEVTGGSLNSIREWLFRKE